MGRGVWGAQLQVSRRARDLFWAHLGGQEDTPRHLSGICPGQKRTPCHSPTKPAESRGLTSPEGANCQLEKTEFADRPTEVRLAPG